MSEVSETAVIAAMATALTESRTIGTTPIIIIPKDYQSVALDKYLPNPTRKTGNLALASAASFVDYVDRHAHPKTTVLLADEQNSRFKAVFNHHSDTEAGWSDHTATYNCPVSPEWKVWIDNNKKEMNQETFALFVENNSLDIVDPEPATMLEIARTLQAKKKVDFASGIRLDNGQTQLTYNEELTGTAGGKGQFNIPEQFALGIPVYIGGPAYKVPVRFRYRIKEGALTIWYDMLRPHKILEDAFKGVLAQIEKGTELPILSVVG